MNAQRRKLINATISSLEQLINDMESARDEEDEAWTNMPEGLQQGEKGAKAEAAKDALDSAVTSLTEAKDYLEEAVSE